ncbi:hypothetical protein TNCV_4108011 [Trichonephila clavipes]|nr:hypothetical protein TNCV_4108011 [Trichonephila clavipes]
MARERESLGDQFLPPINLGREDEKMVAPALSTIQVTVRSVSWFHSTFEGEQPAGDQGPPTSLPFPPTSREDLRLDGYLEQKCPTGGPP